MAQGKKAQNKGTTKTEEAVKAQVAPFVGLNNTILQKTRMRIRDFLADGVNKAIDAELAAQESALEEGMTLSGKPLTMTEDEWVRLTDILALMKIQWKSVIKSEGKTDTKLFSDIDTAVASITGLLDGSIKALSPDEKAKALEDKAKVEAELAEVLAKLNALDKLNL